MSRLSDDLLDVNLLDFDRLNAYFDYSSVYLRTDVITVLASTTVDLYFLHYFHLDSSEVVQLVQFKFKIF